MKETLKRKLQIYGVDVEHTLARFMQNEAIFEKFIMRFAEDGAFLELEYALKRGDYKSAFEYAHKVKGVTANLGLDPIYHSISPLVEELRMGKYTEAGHASYKLTKKAYDEVIEIIKSEQ